jgi:hypothetical protein
MLVVGESSKERMFSVLADSVVMAARRTWVRLCPLRGASRTSCFCVRVRDWAKSCVL